MNERGRAVSSAIRPAGSTAVLLLVAGVCSCTVGPDFTAPEQTAAAYDAAPLPPTERVAGTAPSTGPSIDYGRAIPEQWWTLFHSPALDDTLRTVIAGSATLAAARATLAEAQQSVIAARGPLLPQLDLSTGAQRGGTLGPAPGPDSRLYSFGPGLVYTVDLFGLTKRTIEQQEALADYQRQQLTAAYLTLTGDAVTEAVAMAAARQEIATVEEIVTDDEKNLQMARTKFDVGKAARTDVLTAESQLTGDRTQLATLRQELSAARHAMSVLAGRSPADWSAPDFKMDDFHLPTELPGHVPSELVRHRPDIAAAEAQLHAASATIGVATAGLYPSLTLSGNLGQQSSTIDTLLMRSNSLWSAAAGLSAPLFHGGALEAQKQEAVAAYDAQFATYRQTIATAFGQVADALSALDHDAELLAGAKQSLDIAEATLSLLRVSYETGKSSAVDLVAAQRSLTQAKLAFEAARIQQVQDTVQFFVVMGGGWP